MVDFVGFPKIPRLSRECYVTEKLDGTNAIIFIGEDGEFLVGSRTRWITPECDNHGFARWCYDNKDQLMGLGPGRHFGEWWGRGINRGYGLQERRLSLFNVGRWGRDGRDGITEPPACCDTVPILYRGLFETCAIQRVLDYLRQTGSVAAPGFMKPEGIVVFHVAGNHMYKKTCEKDEQWKGNA